MKRFFKLLMAAVAAVSLVSCGGGAKTYSPADGSYMFQQPQKGDTVATIKTDMGDIKIRFFPDKAPLAVANFIALAKAQKYNGVIFHRVIKDFMIQTGDYTKGDGTGGQAAAGHPFNDEFSPELRNVRGAVSMANSGPNTNGSQFFIVQKNHLESAETTQFQWAIAHQDDVLRTADDGTQIKVNAYYPQQICKYYIDNGGYPSLDYHYTVFGFVLSGMDVVDKIANVAVDSSNNKPTTDVKMTEVDIETVQ